MSNMMSAGDLDRRIQFIGTDGTQDAFGQPVNTPIVLKTVAAQRGRLFATDIQRAQLFSEVAQAKYVTRYHDGITIGMRVRENGTDYYIISVEEVGRKEGLILLCKAAD